MSIDGILDNLRSREIKRQLNGAQDLAGVLDDGTQLPGHAASDVLSAMKNVLKTSNPKLATTALGCITGVMEGMTGSLNEYVDMLLPRVVERLGDTKTFVRAKAQEVVMYFAQAASADRVVDKTSDSHKNKNPRLKEMVATIYGGLAEAEGSSLGRDVQSAMVRTVAHMLEDATGYVRDAAKTAVTSLADTYGASLVMGVSNRMGLRAPTMKQLSTLVGGSSGGGTKARGVPRPKRSGGASKPAVVIPPKETSHVPTPRSAMSADSERSTRTGFSGGAPREKIAPDEIQWSGIGSCKGIVGLEGRKDVPAVDIYTERELSKEVAALSEVLRTTKKDWKERLTALTRFRSVIRGSAIDLPYFSNHMSTMRIPLQAQCTDLRSTICKEACCAVAELSATMGHSFEPFAEGFYDALIDQTAVTIHIIRACSYHCLRTILCNTDYGYHRVIPKLAEKYRAKEAGPQRVAAIEYLGVALRRWSPGCLDRHVDAITGLLKDAILDADSGVRSSAREAFWSFRDLWPSRADTIEGSLDSSTARALQRSESEAANTAANEMTLRGEPVILGDGGGAHGGGGGAGSRVSQPRTPRVSPKEARISPRERERARHDPEEDAPRRVLSRPAQPPRPPMRSGPERDSGIDRDRDRADGPVRVENNVDADDADPRGARVLGAPQRVSAPSGSSYSSMYASRMGEDDIEEAPTSYGGAQRLPVKERPPARGGGLRRSHEDDTDRRGAGASAAPEMTPREILIAATADLSSQDWATRVGALHAMESVVVESGDGTGIDAVLNGVSMAVDDFVAKVVVAALDVIGSVVTTSAAALMKPGRRASLEDCIAGVFRRVPDTRPGVKPAASAAVSSIMSAFSASFLTTITTKMMLSLRGVKEMVQCVDLFGQCMRNGGAEHFRGQPSQTRSVLSKLALASSPPALVDAARQSLEYMYDAMPDAVLDAIRTSTAGTRDAAVRILRVRYAHIEDEVARHQRRGPRSGDPDVRASRSPASEPEAPPAHSTPPSRGAEGSAETGYRGKFSPLSYAPSPPAPGGSKGTWGSLIRDTISGLSASGARSSDVLHWLSQFASFCRHADEVTWEPHVAAAIRAVIHRVSDGESKVAIGALHALSLLIVHQSSLFERFAPTVLEQLVAKTEAVSREVAVAIRATLNVIVRRCDPVVCFQVLTSMSAKESSPLVVDTALSTLKHLIPSLRPSELAGQLESIIQTISRAVASPTVEVRKAAIFLSVEVRELLGPDVMPRFKASLTTAQMRLLQIYLDRKSS